jgi:hypothetical protein
MPPNKFPAAKLASIATSTIACLPCTLLKSSVHLGGKNTPLFCGGRGDYSPAEASMPPKKSPAADLAPKHFLHRLDKLESFRFLGCQIAPGCELLLLHCCRRIKKLQAHPTASSPLPCCRSHAGRGKFEVLSPASLGRIEGVVMRHLDVSVPMIVLGARARASLGRQLANGTRHLAGQCVPWVLAECLLKKKKLHHYSHIRLIRRPIHKRLWNSCA